MKRIAVVVLTGVLAMPCLAQVPAASSVQTPAPPTSTAAAPSPLSAVSKWQNDIKGHMDLVEMNMVLVPNPQMARLTGSSPIDSYKDVSKECQEALKDLDSGLGPALKSAKTDAQLLASTKALYVAAQGYFTNLPPSLLSSYDVMAMTHARLKSDLEAKLNELKLDLKLAAQ